jgi:uncharacterized protein involved in exopolysaccharide biosynthesis
MLILLVGAIVAALAGVRAKISPRVYSGETLLAPAQQDKAGSGLLSGGVANIAALAGVDLGGDSHKEEAIAYLRSRDLAREFITQTRSAQSICTFDRGLLAVFTSESCARIGVEDAVTRFDRAVRFVVEDRRTGLLSLRIDWGDPKVAADWSNAYVRLANRRLRDRDIADADARLRYLESEISRSNLVELHQAAARLMESTMNKEMLARVQADYSFRVIDPAVASPRNRYVRPHFVIETFVGLLVGASLAYIFFLVRDRNRPAP